MTKKKSEVKSGKPQTAASASNDAAPAKRAVKIGERIEFHVDPHFSELQREFPGEAYVPATIIDMHPDGTFDLKFEKENSHAIYQRNVDGKHIRS